jgi:4-amino-4-deoxy-L-arabinose transferase-like glycosyltransferase
MDSQLVLTSLLAAWAVLLAVERGQLRFLLLSALLVGVGFNIKMLQAFMVLPAFYGLYLLTAPFSWLKRLAHLALASLVLAVACLAWPLAVDLTPADQRPFVGSSQNNTVMELILGHNGAARLGEIGKILGIGGNRSPGNRYPPQYAGPSLNPQPQSPLPPQNISPPAGASPSGMAPGGAGPLANETGEPGLLRLFNHQLAGQASWFLPLAIFLAALLPLAQRLPNLSSADSHFSRLVLYRYTLLWAGWLIPQTVFFSFAGLFHRYYLAMLAPAIAALVGGGLVALWRARQGWLNLLVWWITLGLELAIISAFPDWGRWLIPLMLALAGMTTLGMLTRHAPRAALVALFICLLPPTLWSLTPLIYGGDGALPYSGPELLERRAPPMGECQSPECRSDDRLIRYLQAQRGSTQFLVAMQSAMQAAPVILSTGEPVMALGGFSGSDAILSVEELSALVDAGAVRYFWLTRPAERNAIPPGGRLPPGAPGQAQSSLWVVQTCSPVLANEWGGAVNGNPMQLWDCR